jgi:RNA polymerase-binding transcription factor DksA
MIHGLTRKEAMSRYKEKPKCERCGNVIQDAKLYTRRFCRACKDAKAKEYKEKILKQGNEKKNDLGNGR